MLFFECGLIDSFEKPDDFRPVCPDRQACLPRGKNRRSLESKASRCPRNKRSRRPAGECFSELHCKQYSCNSAFKAYLCLLIWQVGHTGHEKSNYTHISVTLYSCSEPGAKGPRVGYSPWSFKLFRRPEYQLFPKADRACRRDCRAVQFQQPDLHQACRYLWQA